MHTSRLGLCAALVTRMSPVAMAQSPKAATYITDEQVKAINGPGVDRQIVNVDIGKLHRAVGIIRRGPTTPVTAGVAGHRPADGGAGGRGAGQRYNAPGLAIFQLVFRLKPEATCESRKL